MFCLGVDPELNYRKLQQLSEVSNETGQFQPTGSSHRLAQPLATRPALGAGLRVAIVAGGLGYLAQCR